MVILSTKINHTVEQCGRVTVYMQRDHMNVFV